jgi:hypothetical protein
MPSDFKNMSMAAMQAIGEGNKMENESKNVEPAI